MFKRFIFVAAAGVMAASLMVGVVTAMPRVPDVQPGSTSFKGADDVELADTLHRSVLSPAIEVRAEAQPNDTAAAEAEVHQELELNDTAMAEAETHKMGAATNNLAAEPKPNHLPAAELGAQAAATDPAGMEDLHFAGTIESISAGLWVIGGRAFQVDASTILDNELAVGVAVDVVYEVLADGTFHAIKIETLISGKNRPAEVAPAPQPAEAAPSQTASPSALPMGQALDTAEDFHFAGAIESMSADAWVIGGRAFRVDALTILDSGLAIEVLARVEFLILPHGALLAVEIETDLPAEVAPPPSQQRLRRLKWLRRPRSLWGKLLTPRRTSTSPGPSSLWAPAPGSQAGAPSWWTPPLFWTTGWQWE